MSNRIYPLIIYLLLTVLNPCPGLFTVLVIEPNTGQWMPESKGTHLKKALLVQCPAPNPAPCPTSSVRTNRADGCSQEPGVSLAVFHTWVIVMVVGWFTLEGIIRSPITALLGELSAMRQEFSASSNWSFIWSSTRLLTKQPSCQHQLSEIPLKTGRAMVSVSVSCPQYWIQHVCQCLNRMM